MTKKKTMKWLATGGLVLGVALMGGTVWATNMFPSGTPTVINGSVTAFGATGQPWVAELFSAGGQCMRLAVTVEGTDLETVVRAPNGQVFRNDDGGAAACPLCPIVNIASTPNNGWYTVSLSQFAGAAVGANFTLQYSLLPVGSASCLPATPPFNSLGPDQGKPQAGAPVAPQAGEPGAP